MPPLVRVGDPDDRSIWRNEGAKRGGEWPDLALGYEQQAVRRRDQELVFCPGLSRFHFLQTNRQVAESTHSKCDRVFSTTLHGSINDDAP